jgi:hypothetical protein
MPSFTRVAAIFRFCVLTACVAGVLPVLAQDPFEIQVYEYELVPKGQWNLETHMNYRRHGTTEFEGTVAPSSRQFHLTYELTHGITDWFEMAGYLVLAHRAQPDGGWDYAGWRLRPRFGIPPSWNWPVGLSLSTEIGFPKNTYEENPTTFELRPIIEKRFGRIQVDLNPTLARALRGPGSSEGWEFEPAARIAFTGWRLEPSLEYYGATGPIRDVLPVHEQSHQFYPGWDLQITKNIVWNFGIGIASTSQGDRLVYKMRLGVLFGKPSR